MLLFADELMQRHDPGSMHPESPERLRAVLDALDGARGVGWQKPTPATREQVLRVHRSSHVDRIDGFRGRSGHLDADTSVSPDSVAAAYLAAGAVVDAVTAVMRGDDKHAFALVRPPGHHAEARARRWASACSTTWPSRPRTRAPSAGCERVLDRRLGRAPRQRHAAQLLRARRRAVLSACTSFRSTPAPARGTRAAEGAGRGLHHQHAAVPPAAATATT